MSTSSAKQYKIVGIQLCDLDDGEFVEYEEGDTMNSRLIKNADMNCNDLMENYIPAARQFVDKNLIEDRTKTLGNNAVYGEGGVLRWKLLGDVTFIIYNKHVPEDERSVTVKSGSFVQLGKENNTNNNDNEDNYDAIYFLYNGGITIDPPINDRFIKNRQALKNRSQSNQKTRVLQQIVPSRSSRRLPPGISSRDLVTVGGKRKSRKRAKKVRRRRTHRRN